MSARLDASSSACPVTSARESESAACCPLIPPNLHLDGRAFTVNLGLASAAGYCTSATPLDKRIRFEALMADLSATFVNLPPGEVDARIDDALRRVVEFLQVERSSFAEVSEIDDSLSTTHSYVAPGFPPFSLSVLDSQLPWFAEMVRQGNVLRLAQLPDDLPDEAAREREYCIRVGLKSQLTIPLKVGGSQLFAIGCASFRSHRQWPEDLVLRLRLLGEVFANAVVRHRAEEGLRAREKRYRDLVESTRAVPWEADPQTLRTTYMAPQSFNLLGYPPDSWSREGFWVSRLHPDDSGSVVRAIGDAVTRGSDKEMEYRLVAADGKTIWVHDLITVQTEDGVPGTLRGVMIDITARKRAEEEASRLRDQLAYVARVTTLGELAVAIAHEVNQPLCAIVSNAETAQGYLAGRAVDMGEVRDALEDIVSDGRRASEIIGRIRAMLQKQQTHPAPFNLNDAIREVALLTRHRLTRDNVTLALRLAADLPPVVGDRVQIQQVIANLMVNAADAVAAEETGRRQVCVSTAWDWRVVTVCMQDTGPGINSDLQGRLFDAFFTTKSGGTGIGLSISRTIVEAHGGRIWVDSAVGGGADFRFTLPLVVGPSP
jgi:PAS domain S-box-containing protein